MRAICMLAAAVLVLTGCGATRSLDSARPDRPVSIDAQLSEWANGLSAIDDGRLNVGVQNDGEFMYVSLSTQDRRAIAQIMNQGMILWVDPAGGKERTFGVRYPLGVIGTDDPDRRLGDDLASNRIRIERSMQEVELVGSGGQTFRRRKDAVPGLEIHAEYDHQVLTYEAKVPLKASSGVLYAIGVEPGQQIGLGFASPEGGDGLLDTPGRGGLPGGTLSSADGRGRYGSRRGSPTARLPQMSHWMTVTLADAPAGGPVGTRLD